MKKTINIEDISFEEVHEIEKYGTHYSEKKLWDKIRRIAKKAGATVLRPALILYFLLEDGKVPIHHKGYIIGALGYFIMPFDLIPDGLLPVIGFADDIALMTFVLKVVKDSITSGIEAKADHTLNTILHLNNI